MDRIHLSQCIKYESLCTNVFLTYSKVNLNCCILLLYITLPFKSLRMVMFYERSLFCFIYLIKNTVKTVKYYNHFKKLFLCEYVFNCNLFLWCAAVFQHHFSSLQCHMIFRNHNNILIYCSRNISDYYQCWKQSCCTIFLWKPWCILFSGFTDE